MVNAIDRAIDRDFVRAVRAFGVNRQGLIDAIDRDFIRAVRAVRARTLTALTALLASMVKA